MTISEAYVEFKQRVERNLTNDEISTDRGRFIALFNEAQLRYVDWMLEKRHEDDIHYLKDLVVHDLELTGGETVLNHIDFSYPDDFHSHINLQVYASSGKCTGKLRTDEKKQEDIEQLLEDPCFEPSFEARETFYTLGSKLKVYVKGFNLNQVYLTYYRYPRKVDISNYIHTDGSPSTNIDPEWDDKSMYRILSAAVYLHNHNQVGNTLDKDRIFSDI